MVTGNRKAAIGNAIRAKPRLLVCAPSNAAVDNVILKIMEDGFIDGSSNRYNPSIIRVGVGKSIAVKDVALENQVDVILAEHMDLSKLESSIAGYKMELQRIQSDISKIRARLLALTKASPWPLSKDWEIRIDEDTFEHTGRVYFVNHIEKKTSYECPPPPEPDETQYEATAMPEYRSYMARVVKLYESYNSITTKLERCTITQQGLNGGNSIQVRQQLETHILDTVHIVMTTLGTSGNRVLEAAQKFEVVVVDEAAQSVEPSILSALQLGSRHAILVGDPQQLPATIFNVSGRNTKYDRSLFQRLEEAGHEVFMLNTQYRMHPKISHFPREIFYGGDLKDGPNVLHPDYGGPLKRKILKAVPSFQPFTVLDLESREERGGSSYANSAEANLAVHLFCQLRDLTNGLSTATRIAVITPYSQQAGLLRRTFERELGPHYTNFIEINTVDAFQGREANIVIFSCVRAAGSHGIGFLSDVRRMNVALTRAKHFLLVIARCKSITVNPYWRDLVDHARDNNAVVEVPMTYGRDKPSFPELHNLKIPGTSTASSAAMKPNDPRNPNKGDPRLTMRPKPPPETLAPSDPRAKSEPPVGDPRASKPPPPPPPRTADPRSKALDPRGKPSGETFAAKDPRKKNPPNDPRKGRGYDVG
jgi:senataxin